MKNMTIRLSGDGILKKAWIIKQGQKWDQAEELQINSQGLATKSVIENVEYILSWTLVGTPGASWKLEVQEPPDYQWQYYGSSRWYSTKISLEKTLSEASYSDLRIIRIIEG